MEKNFANPNIRSDLGIIVGSAVAFAVVNQLFRLYKPWSGATPSKTQWKLRNIATSMLHSCITGIWSFTSFFLIDDLREDMVEGGSNFSYYLVALSIGYFIYDLFDMGINRLNLKSVELMGHHAVVVLCFGVAVFLRKFIGFPVFSLFVEVNSLFLHWRQILRILGIPKNRPFYHVISLLNVSTFILFRLGTFVCLSYLHFSYSNRIPRIVNVTATICFVIAVIMNVVLLYRLVRSDFLTVKKKSND
ncbi:TLC domain-containing protein 2-like [Paramacrobiotus metropolitanus]|uniref:TLC domain-containing protein 2-like n=1 Tax=Paramacrobiotus metropolitanus TaxID=2943436 RepID=UPI002445C780|nr:TLC domain-containing protein 2-like [Paramacrobiotus metropolitanus]